MGNVMLFITFIHLFFISRTEMCFKALTSFIRFIIDLNATAVLI